MKATFKALDLKACRIKKTRVDIWQYPLHTEFKEAKDLLNIDERERANRYHFPRHQRRFTVARAMLRLILSRYAQVQPTELSFSYNPYGKPQLLTKEGLQFNLSHSGDLALLAVGETYPVGIDLEHFSARPYEGIGKQLFSLAEIQALQHATPDIKPLVFFHIWAQKEAFIKACGLGLSYPTKQFDVPAMPGMSVSIEDTLHHQAWEMLSFMPQIGCCAALCHHPQVKDIHYRKLETVFDLIQ